jgi:AcrR family transcriptional regulator
MPKIIDNLKEKILIEAKRQVFSCGYSETTIRSVAAECGIAAGTIYNYYPSKDYLIAAFILEDWMALLNELKGIANQYNSVQAIKGIS